VNSFRNRKPLAYARGSDQSRDREGAVADTEKSSRNSIKNLRLMNRNARFGSGFSSEREVREVGWILDGNEKELIRFERRDADAYTRTFMPRQDSASPG